MSLQLIYGRSGSGKTKECFTAAKKLLGAGGKVLFLCPEHISLLAEKEIAADEELFGAESLSFGRLAARVFSKTGPVTADFVDTCTKTMMIKRLLLQNGKKLSVLASCSGDGGFAKSLFDTINTLKSACITPENLRTAAEKAEKTADKLKLCDIALIYEKYNGQFTGTVYDSADSLSLVCEKIEKFRLFSGYTVFADGFNGFSKAQYNVLRVLAKTADKLVVTCPADDLADADSRLFFRGVSMADILFTMAHENGIEVLPNIYLDKCRRPAENPELLHLEKNLFSYPAKQYEDKTENITLYTACSYEGEAELAARTVYEMCRGGNYRYRDFAVVCRKPEIYNSVIKKVFGDYNIPVYTNEKINIVKNPFVHEFLSAFDVITGRFSANSVIRWVKADFHGENTEDIYLLENYITASGSSEKMWRGELKYNGGLGERDFDAVKQCSKRVFKEILRFADNLKGRKTFKSVTAALKQLLDGCGCEEYIINRSASLDAQTAQMFVLAYNGLIDTVNKMCGIFGAAPVTTEKYLEILLSGLSGCDIGQIPQTADSVTVSEPDLFKEEKKVIFVLGANDGVLPKGYLNEGLLSDSDKKLMSDCGFDAPDTSIIKHRAENYLMYSVFTMPSDKLFITYSDADFDGNTLEPSRIIPRILSVFKNCTHIKQVYEKRSALALADAVIPAFNRLTAGKFGANSETAEEWFLKKRPEMYEIIRRAESFDNNPGRLREDIVRGLYGAVPQYSISKAEQFNRCAYSYFLSYGLRAKPRLENKVNPADTGTIMHEIIERFVTENKDNFKNISDAECEKQAAEITAEVMRGYLSDSYFESSAGKIMQKKISRLMKGLLKNIAEYYRKSGFVLYGCEVDFGGENAAFEPIEITLENGVKVLLTGKIDRVDILKANDKYFVNVVDYKSSDKTIDYGQALFGLQLQLPVYIDAICRFLARRDGTVTVPAAILYCKIDYPPAEGSRDYTPEQIREEIKKNMRMRGLAVCHDETAEAMDGVFAVKPDATLSQLERLCEYSYKKLRDTVTDIMSGSISIMPSVSSGKKSCDYCDFFPVCEFDPLFDNGCRYVSKIKREEFFEYVGKMDAKSAKGN